MKKSGKIIFLVILVIVVVAVAFSFFKPEKEAKAVKKPSFATLSIQVKTVEARRGDLELTVSATGDVVALNQVNVYSKVEGRIVELNFDRGDRVKKNQLLARVEDDVLGARLAGAKAALEVARSKWKQMKAGLRPQELEQVREEVQKAQAEFSNAELGLKRAHELFEKGFNSPQQRDEAQLKYDSNKAFLNSVGEKLKMAEEGYREEDKQASLAQVHQAEANLRMAEIKLAESRVTAPIEGIVGERMVDAGAFVHASTGILSIVDMDQVKVIVNVGGKDIPRVKTGLKAEVRLDVYPGRTFTGKVRQISPIVDPESRTAEVEILVDNALHELKPGMFARVDMVVSRRTNSLFVPASALVSSNGRSYLFVNEQGKARRRTVTLGIREDDRVEVLDNLQEGESVIVDVPERLKDSSPIRVANVENQK